MNLPAYHLNELFDKNAISALETCIDEHTAELRKLSVKIHGTDAAYLDCRLSPNYLQWLDHPETAYNEQYVELYMIAQTTRSYRALSLLLAMRIRSSLGS